MSEEGFRRGKMVDFTQCIYLLLIVKEANRINLITDESYREFVRTLLKLNCPNCRAKMDEVEE